MILQYDASDTDVTYIMLASEQVKFLSMVQWDLSMVQYSENLSFLTWASLMYGDRFQILRIRQWRQ